VQAGDILHIPPGTVHAIGAGIVLYEVQQASDITYRLWDWGSARPLHWEQALAAISRDAPPPVRQGALTGAHFGLAVLSARGRMPLPEAKGFQCLTALGAGRLLCGGEAIPFARGDTLFIPEGGGSIDIEGHCQVVRAWARYTIIRHRAGGERLPALFLCRWRTAYFSLPLHIDLLRCACAGRT
jgi:mannose-6-phosphate isomerase